MESDNLGLTLIITFGPQSKPRMSTTSTFAFGSYRSIHSFSAAQVATTRAAFLRKRRSNGRTSRFFQALYFRRTGS